MFLWKIFQGKDSFFDEQSLYFCNRLKGNFFPRVFIPKSWKYTIHYRNIWKRKITVTFVKDPLCFINALLSIIIAIQLFLFTKKIPSFQIGDLSKIVPSYVFVLLPNFFIKKMNFICALFCLRLIFMLRMLCLRKYSVIFSILDIIWNRSRKATFMGVSVFPSKFFFEVSNFLMLKTQIYQKAPFHATTVGISLIELCGLQISKNWLFSVVVK